MDHKLNNSNKDVQVKAKNQLHITRHIKHFPQSLHHDIPTIVVIFIYVIIQIEHFRNLWNISLTRGHVTYILMRVINHFFNLNPRWKYVTWELLALNHCSLFPVSISFTLVLPTTIYADRVIDKQNTEDQEWITVVPRKIFLASLERTILKVNVLKYVDVNWMNAVVSIF